VRAHGYHVVHHAPTLDERRAHPRVAYLEWEEDGYAATRTALDLPVARKVLGIMRAATGRSVLQVPTLGGSLPLSVFAEVARAPLLIVPMANHDNRRHGANDNLRLQNLWDGIELYGALLAELT
jgi:acetylornithine deacetylase/succinyl-diaminopimelate desuccinylase-like protein